MTVWDMETDMEPLVYQQLVVDSGLDPFGEPPVDMGMPDPWFPRDPRSVMGHIAQLAGTTATTWTRANADMINAMLADDARRGEPIQAEVIHVGDAVPNQPTGQWARKTLARLDLEAGVAYVSEAPGE